MNEFDTQEKSEEKETQQEIEENEKNEENISEEQTENKTDEEKEGKGFLNDILEIFESVVISVFVVLMLFTYIARPVTVEGDSMNPTLEDCDKLIMRTLLYTPKVGDIVIVNNEKSYTLDELTGEIVEGQALNKRLIKRVIAVGGQEIDIDAAANTVKVDGRLLEEDYIADVVKTDARAFNYPVTVPEGYVFVMGDNRNNSTDSRNSYVGFVKEEDVLGEAIIRFYPFDKFKLLD